MATNRAHPIDAAIAAVAHRRHGCITRQQLLGLGLGPAAIAHRVRAGRLYRVFTGVYTVGRPPVTPLERACAAVLACGPGAVLSHASAMVLWDVWRRWEEPFEVIAPHFRRRAAINTHRARHLHRREVIVHLGIRTTTLPRALLDCASRLSDRQLARAVNESLRSNYMTRSALGALLAHHPHHPSTSRLVSFVQDTGGPTRSTFEDEFPAFCGRFGLPRPIMNATVAGYEVDALFPAERVIVELDSWTFHRDRQTFETDRDRDADILARTGHVTVRITWKRIERQPGREAERLHRILVARRPSGPSRR